MNCKVRTYFIIYTPATSAIKPSKWLMSIIKFRGYANEKGNSVRSVSLISCICLKQAIDIEDTIYIIMIVMNRSILTDNHSYFEGASNQ
jgi:hypothetical protein